MAQIHLIGGEKGGVGKSFFTRFLVYFCQKRKYPFHLVDADRTNPDVCDRYQLGTKVFFTEDEKKSTNVDIIFERCQERPVFVNLPAQIQNAVEDWIEKNNLVNLQFKLGGEKVSVEIYYWFLCTGNHDSITLFEKLIDSSSEKFGSKIKYVFVKNCRETDEDEWEIVLSSYSEVKSKIERNKIPQLLFRKLGTADRNLIDRKQWTFEWASSEDNAEVGILPRNRIVTYLEGLEKGMEKLKILTPKVFEVHVYEKPPQAKAS